MTTKEIQKIKNKADLIVALDDLKGLVKIIADKNIQIHGYYTYTENETNLKIFVKR